MLKGKKIKSITTHTCLFAMAWMLSMPCSAQCISSKCIWDSLIAVETNNSFSPTQQLQQVVALKKQFEIERFPEDSVYARILHRIGLYEYSLNNEIASNECLTNTLLAVKINTSGNKSASKSFAVNSYFNLGGYYESLKLNDKALSYYDSALQLAKNYPDPKRFGLRARIKRSVLLFQKGDYQKATEESTVGITEANKAGAIPELLGLYNQRAHAFFFQNQLGRASTDVDSAVVYAERLKNMDELAFAFKISAKIHGQLGQFSKATSDFLRAVQTRIKTGDAVEVANDYIDFGNFYLNSMHDNKSAENCYLMALTYANKGSSLGTIATIQANIGALYFYHGMYKEALQYNTKALQSLINTKQHEDAFENPSVNRLDAVANKELLFIIFGNKTETLIHLFRQTKNKAYLIASLQTAQLTDTLLAKMRHSQSAEKSKLYWRNATKWLYSSALEACYLANDTTLAFYFMEKSRGVLLNDALNELGASAHLPAEEAKEEERLQVNIVEKQQKISQVNYTSPEYPGQEAGLIQAKENFEHYIKSLEQKYPSYYQYKYADDVPSLSSMQKYLSLNHQSFVHYFITDTVAFILATTPGGVKFIRLSAKEFDRGNLAAFEQLLADKQVLESNYAAFSKLSNYLYSKLFKPLNITPGKVIICGDDFLIPFEALCSDTAGRKFLIYDYAFSYVYSASYLIKKLNTQHANGNFLGIAPVSFASYSNLPDLDLSADAIQASAGHYGDKKIFLAGEATRQNFFRYAPGYSVVTVFSHAVADTGDNEPAMFMKDSAIHLSELLYFNNPATELVILSACQTDVGKKATGEGIYSLARGFSAAGIPAVAATLWKADDQAIYKITEAFNLNLSQGMSKDVALQKAKLSFLQTGGSQNLLPYYWANMIVAGNVQPLNLSTHHYILLITALIGVTIFAMVVIYIMRAKRKLPNRQKAGKVLA